MGFAVEANLDPGAAARVRALWDDLARRGITSEMPEMGADPHVSLAVFDEVDPKALGPVLDSFARGREPLELRLASVGSFPTAEGVVYLAPVVTPALLEWHADLDRRLERLGARAWDYYRPGSWVPHCTVALSLDPDGVAEAVRVTRESGVFGPAALDEIALVEFRPVRRLFARPVGRSGEEERRGR
jgi:2'-5' RNA ligase